MTKRMYTTLSIEQGGLVVQGEVDIITDLYQGQAGNCQVGVLYVQGTATLSRDPTTAFQAATKQYVDNAVVAPTTQEVVISATDPISTYPNAELWYQP
jgi:hypothetical protein